VPLCVEQLFFRRRGCSAKLARTLPVAFSTSRIDLRTVCATVLGRLWRGDIPPSVDDDQSL
jgi:hypothetical protein